MRDETATIGELKNAVEHFVRERDWESFHHPKDLAISLSLEAAELLEPFQWDERRKVEDLRKDADLVDQVSDELSDILHYVLNFANVMRIDLSAAFEKKMRRNAEKYPVETSGGRHFMTHRNQIRKKRTLTDDEI